MKKVFLVLLLVFAFIHCGGDGQNPLYDEPTLVAIDSTNNRLFILENNGVLHIVAASDRSSIGDQPFVTEDREEAIFDLLPSSPIAMAVEAQDTSTKIFIAGKQVNDENQAVFNRILVLDFDGITLSVASNSPLIFEDSDTSTTDTDNIPGGLFVDDDNNQLFVTDLTLGALYVFSTTTGNLLNSVTIAGKPNKMALASSHLFVANSSGTTSEQVITVVNTATLATTTIDLNIPTNDVAVVSNSTGTVLLTHRSDEQEVYIQLVATDFASATGITSSDTALQDGLLSSGLGISSAVGSLGITSISDGTIFGYVALSDGTINMLTIDSTISTYSNTTLSTATDNLTSIDIYKDTDDVGITVYMAAETSGDLVYTDVGSEDVDARF
ncbi:MAG: hypothetical protein A3G32_02850 [Deltaproteobacteria bacterium RIFCSPLOWO2_12_FULL_40_28]|nr:MAG: hypothetical protein A3C45_00230 [Deltaproteobacteria bacterium RIFCSPHIGHO2_02_FULL_40_28]OGQ20054.1 MAG: hypothetical protein A3E27_02895 [Deltaproteobacteria bacterium RIFCSPHIGHO2_12_FULL_40_32]OGQ40621.1 MAG: hypothetical protein A3I69_10320 [Deltaproteobacteria bacterium RIFCSPLOWO2_02_FULL_40_36]OGQ54290.1 MAG: hypothetical protein A3G32_02850 [Deltaproteobacteria bacterium RIFCSPLOWO2_12_FULL_40_28]